ncbi:7-deoxyloganetin glucosyltransferase isoform X2 [Aegilops tauschii subsp. strangulata]
MEGAGEEKPHAVCLPFPAQGHITPMLSVANLLHAHGFHVTFVNSEYNHARLVRTRGAAVLAGSPGFRFATIPDGMPQPSGDVDDDVTQDIPSLCKSTLETCLGPFRRLLTELNDAASTGDHPVVTCIVSDLTMCFAMDAAKELDVPYVQLWTASTVSYLGFRYFRLLIDRGIVPLQGTIGSLSLWKEQEECLQWLHGKEPASVVYVNFGSITVMTKEQLLEFAWGLANSGRQFMWIIRRDLVRGDAAVLPPEFMEETAGRGFMASWCPQQEVLNHPSVGVFLTHSGWNSTMDSMCGGVPVISWPFFSDQLTNCRYQCNEWGVGMEIDNNVQRNAVTGLITELMQGESGKKMRKRAEEWREKAILATKPGGSSHRNFKELLCDVLLPKK